MLVVMMMVIVMVVVVVMVMVIDGCPMHYENGRECFYLGHHDAQGRSTNWKHLRGLSSQMFSRAMAAMQSWQIAFVV